MYKVMISVIDYDTPYRVDYEEVEFKTIQDALDYCDENSGRRDSYTISSVFKDGINVDWKKEHSLSVHGFEKIKQHMLKQLKEKVNKLENVKHVDELEDFKRIYIYTL